MEKKTLITLLIILAFGAIVIMQLGQKGETQVIEKSKDSIELPEPRKEGTTSVEEAIQDRRSVREYEDEPLSLEELSQLLWAAQGITGEGFKRAAPSAGALYPLEVYVLVGEVNGLDPGFYHYLPKNHSLEKIASKDFRSELTKAAYDQSYIEEAPASLVFTAIYERTTQKYGDKGVRYVHIEAGHAAQNVYLQSGALGLGTVSVGGFEDDKVKAMLSLPEEEQPLYIMPIGKEKQP